MGDSPQNQAKVADPFTLLGLKKAYNASPIMGDFGF